jgi:rhomboid protease GluP
MPFFGRSREMCADCEKQTAPYRQQQPVAVPRELSDGMITKGLVVANVIVFGMMLATGVSPIEPTTQDIMRWGADYGPLTLGPEPWRLFACMFLHIGIIHLAFNMWCLWDLGRTAEMIFGRRAFLATYLASGICGTYLSELWNPMRPSAGASGAIFGVAGMLIAAFKFGHLPIDAMRVRAMLRSVTIFAVYNLFFGLAGGINNMAHLGGLLGGFVIALVFTRFFPPHSERYRSAFFLVFPVVAALLVGGFFGLRSLKADRLAVGQAGLALEKGDCSTATATLERAIAAHPDDAEAHSALGYCYEKANRQEDAFRQYQQATKLDPNDAFSWQQMGWIYLYRKDAPHAVEAFRKGVAIDGKDAELRQGLGEALIAAGQVPEGVKELEQAAQFAPDDPDVLLSLAHAYAIVGRIPEEIAALHKVIAKRPSDPVAHERLADALAKSGDEKGAAQERATAQQLRNNSK